MFVLNDLQKLLVLAFLVTSMLSIGLRSGAAELRAMVQARSFLGRALVANFVLVPLLGFALARLLPLPPGTAAALVLLACVPGGLSTIHFTAKVKGEETMAEALFVLMTLAAVLVSPWVVRMAMPAAAGVGFPHGSALAFVVLAILVPVCAGVVVHDRSPARAPKFSRILGYVSLLPFVAFMIATKSFRKEAMQSLGGWALVAMLLFIVASMAIGWLLGGPHARSRQVLATVTSMRNTAVCLLIARDSPLGVAALTPLIAFSLLMVTPNTLFALANALWGRRSRGRGAAAGKAAVS